MELIPELEKDRDDYSAGHEVQYDLPPFPRNTSFGNDPRLPDKPGHIITGKFCPSGRKCWPPVRSKDIADDDIPWNTPDNRSAQNYIKTIEYFNVGDSFTTNPTENERYRRTPSSTWCNIFVHDVTRAMHANVPHYTDSPHGGNEVSANGIFQRLKREWKNKIGWFEINQDFCKWIQRSIAARTVLPPPNPFIAKGIINAVSKIILSSRILRNLLSQPGFIAQEFANLGLPTIVVWENLKTYNPKDKNGSPLLNKQGKKVIKRLPGHVAIVRPETTVTACVKKTKECTPPSNSNTEGKFVPITAQAGSKNWENRLGLNMLMPDALYFVHE